MTEAAFGLLLGAMLRVLRKPLGVGLLGAFLVGVPVVTGAPQPGLVRLSWELEFEFYDPARIAVTLPGDKVPTTFWYMIYTVTNQSGREVDFYPQFDLVTDTLRVVHGGDHVSPTVFDAIRERHRKQLPFLVPPLKASGKLLQGTDNARASVAIFRDFDPEASQFTIYAAGLSGEVVRVPNPAFDAARPQAEQNLQFFTLRKTLAIRYDIPGDLKTRKQAAPIRTGREWVMR
ncbi:MAG: hypothetical protein V2A79_01635 [Planctomycetota bacterium]